MATVEANIAPIDIDRNESKAQSPDSSEENHVVESGGSNVLSSLTQRDPIPPLLVSRLDLLPPQRAAPRTDNLSSFRLDAETEVGAVSQGIGF